MTQLLDRPQSAARGTAASSPRAGGRASEQLGSVWVRGAFAALSSAAIGAATLVVIVLGVWAADSRSGASARAAIRVALDIWLLAHRVPLHAGHATIALPPLGLTLVFGALLARASAVVARGSRCTTTRDLGMVVAAVTAPYAVITTALAIAARQSGAQPSIVGAFFAGVLVGGVASAIGTARGCGQCRQLWQRVPRWLRDPAIAAGAASGALAGTAALLLLVTLAVHQHAERSLLSQDGGVAAQTTVTLLCLALLPNLLGFGVGYVAGPGFALGASSVVSFHAVRLGPLPDFPLVAAAPHRSSTLLTLGCSAALLLAGGVLAYLILRGPSATLLDQLRGVATAAALVGVGSAIFAALSGGPVGPGRMSAVGPSPWQTGMAAGLEVGLAAAIALLVWTWIGLARSLLGRESEPAAHT